MLFDIDHYHALSDIMRWRRDVRHFLDKPIEPENIKRLKKAIDMSPSVGNSRPWRFVSVEDKSIRDYIISNHSQANEAAAQSYEEEKIRLHYRSLKLSGLQEAPLHLAVFTSLEPEEGRGLGRYTMPETLIYSTIGAIYHLWLMARTLNLGLGWVSILNVDVEPSLNSVLSVSKSWHFTAYLCIGYPKVHDNVPEIEREKWQEHVEHEWLKR